MSYTKGQLINVFGSWDVVQSDGSLVATDPVTVTCIVIDPTGAKTSYLYPTGVVKISAGRYSFGINANQSGTWSYRWESTGTPVGQDAKERSFTVAISPF